MDSLIPQIPPARPPSVPLPQIRTPIHIPFVGCPGADSTSYIGAQFGNIPDLADALHLKHLRKIVNDQIFALIQGELPTIFRAAVYAAKAADLISQVIQFLATLNQVIGEAMGEYNAAVTFVQGKVAEINSASAAISALPAAGLSATRQLAQSRFQEYTGELNAQLGRLATSISCLLG